MRVLAIVVVGVAALTLAACAGATPTATTAAPETQVGIGESDPNRPTTQVIVSTVQVVDLTAIDTHYDNNSISLWWEDPDWEVTYWVVERSTT